MEGGRPSLGNIMPGGEAEAMGLAAKWAKSNFLSTSLLVLLAVELLLVSHGFGASSVRVGEMGGEADWPVGGEKADLGAEPGRA